MSRAFYALDDMSELVFLAFNCALDAVTTCGGHVHAEQSGVIVVNEKQAQPRNIVGWRQPPTE